MTAARQRQKPMAGMHVLLTALVIAATIHPVEAATTEYVVVDRYTGLAINGFDPVAYFTDGTALPGREAFEYSFAGAVWRFRNEGNRAAFVANPDIYIPRFGGYDPVGIARGSGVPGDPRVWLITENQLFLFRTPEARAAFRVDPDRTMATAEIQWPTVQRTLSP